MKEKNASHRQESILLAIGREKGGYLKQYCARRIGTARD